MDKVIPTISANHLQISSEVQRSQRTSFETGNVDDQGSDRLTRRGRWENTPGIRVSLQSLEQEPQVNDYQKLRSDGRRKEATMDAAPIEHVAHNFEANANESARSVNPRSRVILDSFIQQMGGAEQSVSSGSYIDTNV